MSCIDWLDLMLFVGGGLFFTAIYLIYRIEYSFRRMKDGSD